MPSAPSAADGRSWFDPSRWIQPQTLSAFVEMALPREAVLQLRAHLETAAEALALRELQELHFLRLFVIEAAMDLRGQALPARLALSAVFDGTAAEFLDRWIARARSGLVAIFKLCAGFPVDCDDAGMRDWLLQHAVRPQTYYIGWVRTRLTDIRAESQLREAIETFVDTENASGRWAHGDARRIHGAIRDFVGSRADLPQGPRAPTHFLAYLLQALDFVRVAGILVVPPAVLAWLIFPGARSSVWIWLFITILTLLGIVATWFLIIRWYELREHDAAIVPTGDALERLLAKEDHTFQNQFTMLSLVRDTRFRRLNLHLMLWFSNVFSRHFWNRGKLVGIGTIHFARIHQLDEGRRMLFMSDFDGSWERYLFDFLDVGSFAVVPNWTNLHGCPPSRFMLWPPKDFAARFLPFTRANQLATDLWYSAIDYLTVSEIGRNAAIRAGLFRSLADDEARAWLQLL